jgi:hypothetical protein
MKAYGGSTDKVHTLIFPLGKSPWFPQDRRLDEPNSWSHTVFMKTKFLPLLGIKPQLFKPFFNTL